MHLNEIVIVYDLAFIVVRIISLKIKDTMKCSIQTTALTR